jgi:hypothetical protein
MHAQEDFLRDLLGFCPVPEHSHRDAEDAMLILDHQVLEGGRGLTHR